MFVHSNDVICSLLVTVLKFVPPDHLKCHMYTSNARRGGKREEREREGKREGEEKLIHNSFLLCV